MGTLLAPYVGGGPKAVADAASTERTGWARLWATAHPFARPMPRAGAWYPVVGEASGERAVLEVRGKRVAVRKTLLEFRSERPKVFTVVVRSRDADSTLSAKFGREMARIYAVCPACTQRVPVVENQVAATCAKCGHQAEIAWWETD
ncbi:MAG: hypothetical protein ABR998_14570 [Gemmatimonadales bacterium]